MFSAFNQLWLDVALGKSVYGIASDIYEGMGILLFGSGY
jgi:hypothetical protein